ncbi:MAG: hypothetical protein HQ475_07860 [SAR202 cluster bacterium]|nr:hypothetical protein [SAR202 cluster bacterium]
MSKNEIYYNLALQTFDVQFRKYSQVRLMAAGLVGVTTTLVGLAAVASRDWSGVYLMVGFLMIVAWFVSLGFCVAILHKDTWTAVRIPAFKKQLEDKDDDEIALAAGDAVMAALKINVPKARGHAEKLSIAVYFFAAQGVILGFTFFSSN